MPIKLDSSEKFRGKKLTRKEINLMVQNYRLNLAEDELKYTHFPIVEMLDLFISNGLIDDQLPLRPQMDEDLLKNSGVKLYIGKHGTGKDTPTGYHNLKNIIVCTTKIIGDPKDFLFEDMLTDKKDYVSIAARSDESGLDMGNICPPDCPNQDPVEEKYDIGVAP